MVLSLLTRILQLPLAGFADCIQRVNVNHVSFEDIDGKAFVRKRRSWYDWALIAPGNIVFRFRQTPVRVLYKGEWVRWERTLKLALRNERISAGKELLCEKISGQPLSDYLSTETKFPQKLASLKTATLALKALHKTSVELAGFERPIKLSHGDAAIANVLYEIESNQAEWFDFDLRHDLRIDAVQRHADDLRALLFTAGCCLRESELESLVKMVRLEYRCERVWAALQNQLISRWFWLDLFHPSQTQRVRSRANQLNKASSNQILTKLILNSPQ